MPTRNPKITFLKSAWCKEMDQITSTDAFHIACDYALLILEDDMPLRASPNESADCHQQMVGARRVLDILKTLPEPKQAVREPHTPSLNYKV